VEVVNSNGGTAAEKVSACKSRGIVRPGGVILGVQVGGGTNELRCAAWVSQLQSLCHVWCRSRHLCAMCGVVGAVVAPHVVSRSWSLRRVAVVGAIVASHRCRSHCRCAMCGAAVPVVCCMVSWLQSFCYV